MDCYVLYVRTPNDKSKDWQEKLNLLNELMNLTLWILYFYS